jgi:uncharacterized membrane protein (TIGR02234 family)
VVLIAAVLSLAGSVLLMRSATGGRSDATRYSRHTATEPDGPAGVMSERMIWDALDEGSDPTQDPTSPDNKGR